MAYSSDLRKRALDFIEGGGKKSEAARRFSVARSTLYRWLKAEDPMAAQKTGPKKMRVIDEEALRKHVVDFPDLTHKERAAHFGVSEFCIRYGFRKLGITRKKKEPATSNAVMRSEQSIAKNSNSKKTKVSLPFM